MSYNGPERRKHRVLITENTEYHLRANRCVGVRDPITGEWQPSHRAIGRELQAGLRMMPSGSLKVSFGHAGVGDQICFSNDLVTTPVMRIARPGLDTVERYVAVG